MKATEWWKNEVFAPFFGGNKAAPTQQQLPSNVVPIGAGKGGAYGYTGKGADGVAQPERRVPGIGNGAYDAHESEFVLDANTTQAIGPDVLAQVMKAAKSGKLDLNKLREAVGMEQKPGFQTGGAAPAIGRTKSQAVGPNDLDPIKPDPIGPITIPTQQEIKPNTLDPIKPDTISPVTLPKQQVIGPNNLDPIKPVVVNPVDLKTGKEIPPAKNIGVLPSPIGKKPDVVAKIPPMADKNVNIQAVNPIGKKPDVKAVMPADKNAAIKAINTLPVEVQDELKKQNIPQQDIIDYFMGIMKGDNPYFKMLQDMLGQKIGGAGAAASAAMKQEAAMSGWGKEQLSSLGIGRQRDVEANASQAIGQLATQQAGMGMEAANKLWGMQQDVQQQENWEKQFGLSKEQWEKEFGWQKESWEKSFDYTKLTDAQKNEQWQKMFDNDNAKWQKTWDESLKDKDFNKQTDMLNALLASGGEANLKKASEMMKQMYGQDIDFDNMLDKEKQGDFNTAWNNMGGLIASNMDWEQALLVMKKDGTFDKLGMTEDDLKKVYDKQKLQNDPVYKMMNQVDSWVEQGIMTKEQGEQYKDLFQWSLTNPDGFEIADGWVVKDQAGNEVGFFKNKKERDDFMNANKDKGYTSSDDIVKGHISKKPIGGDSGTGPDTGTGTGVPIPQGGTSGDIFLKDGKVFRINEKGVAEEYFDADIPDNIKNGDSFLVGEGPTAEQYVLGQNGVAKKIDDTVYKDIWGTNAQRAIDYGTNSPYYKNLMDMRIKEIMSGKKDFSKLDNGTINAMKNNKDVPNYNMQRLKDNSIVSEDKLGGTNTNKERYSIKALEDISFGGVMVIDGQVVKYTGKRRKKRGGTDGTYYQFTDQNGKVKELYCKGGTSEDIYWS